MSNTRIVSGLGGHTASDDAAYEMYTKFCKRMEIPPLELVEYLKVTQSIQPQPIAWGGAR